MITKAISLYLTPATFTFSVIMDVVIYVMPDPTQSDYAKRMNGEPV